MNQNLKQYSAFYGAQIAYIIWYEYSTIFYMICLCWCNRFVTIDVLIQTGSIWEGVNMFSFGQKTFWILEEPCCLFTCVVYYV